MDILRKTVTTNLEEFQFSKAGEKIYHFFWHEFCDIWIEKAKKLNNQTTAEQIDNVELKKTVQETILTLQYTLEICLKLLHPFMPFVTEKVWQEMGKKELLMPSKWPC